MNDASINFDNTLYIRGKAPSGFSYYDSNWFSTFYARFDLLKDASVAGNIMALMDWENVSTVQLSNYAFYGLFEDCTHLTDASGLTFPATVWHEQCYRSMFYGCSSLIASPILYFDREIIEDEGSCSDMFNGCSALSSITFITTGQFPTGMDWVANVAENGTFRTNAEAPYPSDFIPSGWTVQNYSE